MRYEVIGWDGFAYWQSHKTGNKIGLDEVRRFMAATIKGTAKIYDRKLKKFVS